MAEYERRSLGRVGPTVARGELSAVDQGLRSYMIQVYNYMGLGMVITGLAAYAIYMLAVTTDASLAATVGGRAAAVGGGRYLTEFGVLLWNSPVKWVLFLAPLALVFFFSFRVDRMSVSAAQTTFWVYAALVGVSLSSILVVFTSTSIARTFFITAASFGALSLYGYTTRRDLSAMGSFLMMGLFGLILAMVVNLFLGSTALQFAISVIGVLVFAGLTAYDTQRIKEMYVEGDALVSGRNAVKGALSLYLDFLNLFMFLLNFMGERE